MFNKIFRKFNNHKLNLRYVACVSFPRSGHHLLHRLLRHYFRRKFHYCQFYERPRCCNSIPCVKKKIVFTKNHDFNLTLPIITEVPYLIQIRNFLEAITSNYTLFLRNQVNIEAPKKDSRAQWENFAKANLSYYKGFVHKWIQNTEDHASTKLIIRYEDLMSEPLSSLEKACLFFNPSLKLNERRLNSLIAGAALEDVKLDKVEVVNNFGVKQNRQLEKFKYFDPNFYGELEAALHDEFLLLGYPFRYSK